VTVFLHDGARLENPQDVVAVQRHVSVTEGRVADAALNALAAHVSEEEEARGLFSQVQRLIRGSSECGGSAFRIAIDAGGRATARLCYRTESGGVLDDARFSVEVQSTLRQFSTVRDVVILTRDGHCFGDMSGLDRCLMSPNPSVEGLPSERRGWPT
jgi:hypothetical protein